MQSSSTERSEQKSDTERKDLRQALKPINNWKPSLIRPDLKTLLIWSSVFTGSALTLTLAGYLVYGAFGLLSKAISASGAATTFFVGSFLLFHKVCQLIVFPGSIWFFKHQQQTQQCAYKAQTLIYHLHGLLNALNRLPPQNFNLRDTMTVYQLIQAVKEVREQYTIQKNIAQLIKMNKIRLEYLQLFDKVAQEMQKLKIKVKGKDICLYELTHQMTQSQPEPEKEHLTTNTFFMLQDSTKSLIKEIESFMSRLEEHGQGGNVWKQTRQFFTRQKPYGSYDQGKAEMKYKMRGIQFQVSSDWGGVQIECMIIPAKLKPNAQNESLATDRTINYSELNQSMQSDQQNIDFIQNINAEAPTVMFCNPNAACMEFLPSQSEFLHYYNRLGLNVIIWNYPGYGSSSLKLLRNPFMSMKRIQQDGLKVAQYAKTHLIKGKFGVHGESLGGSVANFISSKLPLDFAIISRTFASLQHEAMAFGGKFLLRLFEVLTLGGWPSKGLQHWKDLNTQNKCYRIFAADSHDTIVPNRASLKTAIVRDLVQQQTRSKADKYCFGVQDYLLTDERKKLLIDDLSNLMQMETDFAYWQKHKVIEEPVVQKQQDRLDSTVRLSNVEKTYQNQQTNSDAIELSEIALDEKSQGDNLLRSSNKTDNVFEQASDSKNQTGKDIADDQQLTNRNGSGGRVQSSSGQEQDEIVHSRVMTTRNSVAHQGNRVSRVSKNTKEQIKVAQIEAYYSKVEQGMNCKTDFKQLAKILAQFKRMTDDVDASGKTLEHIFSKCKVLKRPPKKEESFNVWLATLEVFGSSQANENGNLKACRKQALDELRNFSRKLENLIGKIDNQHRQSGNEKGALTELVQLRLQNVQESFESIYQLLLNPRNDKQEEKKPRKAFDSIKEPTEEDIGGHFINLNCGHNGFFSHAELQCFQEHEFNQQKYIFILYLN